MGISATDFGPHIQNQAYLVTNREERESYDKKAEMYFYLGLLCVFAIALVFL